MNLGNWPSALFKSILIPALLILTYSAYKLGWPQGLNDIGGFLLFSILFLSAYIIVSMLGWLTFGLPAHWLICRHSNGSYFLYIAFVLLFSLVIYWLYNSTSGVIVYSTFALIQALIFRYYVFKAKKRI